MREFCELAFTELDLDYREYVKVDERFYRPAEVDLLIGDSTKARTVSGWQPQYTFPQLVKEMVQRDLEGAKLAKTGVKVKSHEANRSSRA